MAEFFEDRPFFKTLEGKLHLVGVEIGVDSAENAYRMMTNLDIKKLYLIDPWCGYGGMDGHGVIGDDADAQLCYEHAIKIMAEFGDKIIFIKAKSENAVKAIPYNMDFVYIDGNHRYEYVKKDIELYYPKVKIGGVLAGHDFKSGEAGVKRAVEEYFDTDYTYCHPSWDWFHVKKFERRK